MSAANNARPTALWLGPVLSDEEKFDSPGTDCESHRREFPAAWPFGAIFSSMIRKLLCGNRD